MTTYHNTAGESDRLPAYKLKCLKQDELVMYHFKTVGMSTPSEAHQRLLQAGLISCDTPLTSIRRSISNLTKNGLLDKTDNKKGGAYGRAEYVWQYTPDPTQLRLTI